MPSIDPNFSAWLTERHLRLRISAGSPQDAESLSASLAAQIRVQWPERVADVCHAGSILQLEFATVPTDHARQLDSFLEQIDSLMSRMEPRDNPAAGRVVEIPACYHEALAPDLSSLAAEKSCDPRELVRLHASAEYTVRFMGFSPGFAYMRGLSPRLAAPRLESPRPRVAPGSIAIADDQCGIYPHASAGGWRLVARTPVRLFDASRAEPSRLRPGDRVRFVEISLEDFNSRSRDGHE